MKWTTSRRRTKNNQRLGPLGRGRPDRIAESILRYTRFGNLLDDRVLGSAIVLAVLFIALVLYDGVTVPDIENDPGLASDYEALLAARDALAGSAQLNWSEHVPIEVWDGIKVGGNPRRVNRLELREGQLTGTIPDGLGSLVGLTHLNLRGNRLSGIIPAELGQLSKLEDLLLHDNQLSGTIPAEIGELSNLQRLWLSNNQLTGPIPSDLGRLSNLVELNLSINQLSETIPTELSQLTNLKRLFLHDNQLSGTIPTDIGDLSNLQTPVAFQ